MNPEAEDDFSQRLNKLEASSIEKTYVFEQFRYAVGGHGVRACGIA
jgi:hypothetical protein